MSSTNSDKVNIISTFKDKYNEISTGISKHINEGDSLSKIILLIAAFIFLLLILWILRIIFLQKNLLNCNDLDVIYKNKNTFISSFAPNGNIIHTDYEFQLFDYYIKSAYNSCSAGQPTNSFVSTCALETCIKQGYRLLDFEVYSVDKKPVISTSSVKDYKLKETYNYVDFDDAMEKISSFAFSSNCPNNYDPLLLHFRIMTNHKDILDKMALSIVNHLNSRLLGPEFGYENNGVNLGTFPLKNFVGKIIIIIDKTNPLYIDSKLDEIVNITSNSIYLRLYRDTQLVSGTARKELIDYNKENMSIVLPQLSRVDNNYNPNYAFNSGCQLVAVNMQNFDEYLEYYNKLFDENNSAFVLKPKELRGEPPVIKKFTPPNPLLKQGPKTTQLATGHSVTF